MAGFPIGGFVLVVLACPWLSPRSEPCRPSRRRSRFYHLRKMRDVPSHVATAPYPSGQSLPEEADRHSSLSEKAERPRLSVLVPPVGFLLASRPASNKPSSPHRQ